VVKYLTHAYPSGNPVTKYLRDDTINMYVIVQNDAQLASAFAGVRKFEARPGQILQSRNTVPHAALAHNNDLVK
jgi:hypothetical protein